MAAADFVINRNQLPPQTIINHESKASQPASIASLLAGQKWPSLIGGRSTRRQASQSQLPLPLPLPLQLRHTPFTRCQPASQQPDRRIKHTRRRICRVHDRPRLRMTRLSLNEAQEAHRSRPTTPMDGRQPGGNQSVNQPTSQPANHASNRCNAMRSAINAARQACKQAHLASFHAQDAHRVPTARNNLAAVDRYGKIPDSVSVHLEHLSINTTQPPTQISTSRSRASAAWLLPLLLADFGQSRGD